MQNLGKSSGRRLETKWRSTTSEVRRRLPRQARHPRIGEKVMVGECVTVTFKPGRVMEGRVAMERGRAVQTVLQEVDPNSE